MTRHAAATFTVALATALLSGRGAVLADNNFADRLRQEALFQEYIEKYLQAEACAKLYGGHEATKNQLLAAAKEVSRNLPEADVEAIWSAARTKDFTMPPLPPNEQMCADLRSSVTR